MKKVLLINTNTVKIPYPVPPIGLCMIAESLQPSYEVQLYDGMFDEGTSLASIINTFNPDFIGCGIRNVDNMSFTNPEFYLDTVKNLFIDPAKQLSKAPLILGGSGFSIFPSEMLHYFDVSYGVSGEGEETFLQLLQCLESGNSPHTIPGVVLQTNSSNIENTFCKSPEIKNQIGAKAYSYLDFSGYKARGAYSIQTKRGCSHRCVYCTYPIIEGRKFRSREVKEIVDEIEKARELIGDIMFEFVDSTFNDPKDHAESICKEIIGRKLKVRLRTMGINPNHTHSELFSLMREAGFVQIDATPDTASPAMLKNLGKNFNLTQLQKTGELIKASGMPTMWFFVFGGPGENYSTIDETFDFIDQYIYEWDLVYIASSLRIYPQTPLFHTAVAEGKISAHQNLLHPVFYENPEFNDAMISDYLRKKIGKRHNIIFTHEARPAEAMMAETMKLRAVQQSQEPMFRSLLRVRKQWIDTGKLMI